MFYYALETMLSQYFVSIPVILLFFALQLYLCTPEKKTIIKLIPICILLIITLFAISIYHIDSEWSTILVIYFVMSPFVIPAIIGVVLACVFYGIKKSLPSTKKFAKSMVHPDYSKVSGSKGTGLILLSGLVMIVFSMILIIYYSISCIFFSGFDVVSKSISSEIIALIAVILQLIIGIIGVLFHNRLERGKLCIGIGFAGFFLPLIFFWKGIDLLIFGDDLLLLLPKWNIWAFVIPPIIMIIGGFVNMRYDKNGN